MSWELRCPLEPYHFTSWWEMLKHYGWLIADAVNWLKDAEWNLSNFAKQNGPQARLKSEQE